MERETKRKYQGEIIIWTKKNGKFVKAEKEWSGDKVDYLDMIDYTTY